MRIYFYILVIFLLTSCNSKNDKDTFKMALSGDISSIDPAICYDTICALVVSPIYETLYEYEYLSRPYKLRPLLAEKLPEISPDKRTYTFKIKKNIYYHDQPFLKKRMVKAQDFIWAIKRLAFQGTQARGWWLFDGKIVGLNDWRSQVGNSMERYFNTNVQGLVAPDDHTLIIKLTKPYPQILFALALSFSSPIPKEAIEFTKNDLSQSAVGTGAYLLDSISLIQEAKLVKNPHYITSSYPEIFDSWSLSQGLDKDKNKKLPFIEKIHLKVIKEAQTEWLNFKSKKVDIINLTKDHYELALNSDGTLKQNIDRSINLQSSPTLIYWWLQFNMKDNVVGTNLNLRKAIAHAVDIDKFISLFTYNFAQKAQSIYPPSIPGYPNQKKTLFNYDLIKAKEYLKLAGYPNGENLPPLKFDIRGSDTRKRQMGEFIQQELKKIGINIQLELNTFPAFLEKSRKGELQFWQGGWVLDYPDAENVLQLLSSSHLPPGPNTSQYSNNEFDKMFQELILLEDGERKYKLMSEMEDLVQKDLPWIMQYYSNNFILYHTHLENFRYSDITYNYFKYLKIK